MEIETAEVEQIHIEDRSPEDQAYLGIVRLGLVTAKNGDGITEFKFKKETADKNVKKFIKKHGLRVAVDALELAMGSDEYNGDVPTAILEGMERAKRLSFMRFKKVVTAAQARSGSKKTWTKGHTVLDAVYSRNRSK